MVKAREWNAPLSLEEKVRLRIARVLFRLPHWLQIKLSGRPHFAHGEDRLHPEMQLFLALTSRGNGKRLTDLPPHLGRLKMRRECFVFAGPVVEVGRVESLEIPVPHGSLAARLYVPKGNAEGRPLLVFFHGGGFALGDLETHDEPCRFLCNEAGIHVLSVDYRLAPEFPFPAALEDAEAAFSWAVAHATKLGAGATRIGIGGDSAGANLAAVIALDRKREATPDVQLLIYPVVDSANEFPSRKHFEDGFFLSAIDIERFGEWYAPGQDPSDPRISPLLREDHAGVAPAIIVTAAFDPLRDEGEAYARVLESHGVETLLLRYPGLIHGFINLIGLCPACRDATLDIARAIKEHWQ